MASLGVYYLQISRIRISSIKSGVVVFEKLKEYTKKGQTVNVHFMAYNLGTQHIKKENPKYTK